MYFTDFLIKGASPSHNKAYALHSLAVVRATPNRGYKAAATSHKQNVSRHAWRAERVCRRPWRHNEAEKLRGATKHI